MNPDALIEATQTAMDALLDATGHTEGKEAYKYMIPAGVANAWALSIGGGPDDVGAFPCSPVESIRFTGKLEGRFWKLEDAQRVGLAWVSATPITGEGKIIKLRITAPPSITVDGFQATNSDGVFVCYFVTLPMECVIDVSDG